MKNALIYLVVFAAIQIGAGAAVQALWRLATGNTDITAMMLIATTLVYGVITVAVFLLAKWSEVSRSYLKSRPWGVIFWSVMAAVGIIIPSAWFQEQIPELRNVVEMQFDMILRDRYGYVVVGLLAPIVEELVFRGAILRALLRWTPRHWLAIGVSAVFFALIHFNPAQMPHALLGGMLLGWMYYRTGSIVPGVAFHWVNNSVAYLIYNVMPDPDMPLAVWFGGSQTRVTAALLFSLCIFVPAIYQLAIRMRKAC